MLENEKTTMNDNSNGTAPVAKGENANAATEKKPFDIRSFNSYGTPISNPSPSVNSTFTPRPTPAANPAPAVNSTSMVDPAPAANPAPAVNSTSMVNPAPAVNSTSMVNPAPAVNSTSMVNPASAVNPAPMVNPYQTSSYTPTESNGTPYSPMGSYSAAPLSPMERLQREKEAKEAEKEFKRKAKKRFALVSLSIIAMFILFYLTAGFGIGAIQMLSENLSDKALINISFAITSLATALICYPVGALLLSPIKSCRFTPEEKHKLSFTKILASFCAAYGLMIGGNIIGNIIHAIIGSFFNRSHDNIVAGSIEGVSVWVLVVFLCIFPGVFEELIFRKLLIDKTREFGNFAAVIFSAFTFGLFHANLEQFFYAFFIGLLFGYIYTKTGKIIYTIILHILANFFGSVIGVLLADNAPLLVLYGLFMLAIGGIGVIYIVFLFLDDWSKLKKDKGVTAIGGGSVISSALLNWGAIIMMIFFAYYFINTTISSFI